MFTTKFTGTVFSDLKKISQSLELFFLTVGQNSFGNKIPFLRRHKISYEASPSVIISNTKGLTVSIYCGRSCKMQT